MVSAATLTRDMAASPSGVANDRPAVERTELPAVVSVVVVVLVDEDEIISSYHTYRDALERSGRSVEFIYVLDEGKPKALEGLK
ncbi:MAG: hypothetical protein ACR2P3_06875, partial [Geminicoccaceae bacterium]